MISNDIPDISKHDFSIILKAAIECAWHSGLGYNLIGELFEQCRNEVVMEDRKRKSN